MKIIKQGEQRGRKTGRLPIYVYLGYLLICTLLLTGVSFANYVSTSTASDSACVAKGMVTVSYDESKTEIEMSGPSDHGGVTESSFTFDVTNNDSEVAIRYDVVVTLEESLPDGVTMKLDGKNGEVEDNNIYTFSNMGTFQAGVNDIKTHTLSFTGDFSIYQTVGEFSYPVEISIRSEQID